MAMTDLIECRNRDSQSEVAMHAVSLLHRLLCRACPEVHRARLEAVRSAVVGVITGRRLSIAGVGRAMAPGAKTKHRIKRIDRLAGNRHLEAERVTLYRAMARSLVGTQPQPLIVLDWSDARYDRSMQLLRASIVVEGRSLTVYEEVHPLQKYDNRQVRQRFLERLRDCLPPACRPILIADAGFRVSWYRQVEAMGWDWIARVRGRALYRARSSGRWLPITSLYDGARTKPAFFGEIELTQSGEHRCRLYRVRMRKKGRSERTMYGKRRKDNRSLACARRQMEPWVLATSLRDKSAEQICKLYRCRTQIEGTFRDMKNAQWGFHLRAHRTHTPARLAVLVLLGTLAAFAAYVTGFAGTQLNLQREYQANTRKGRVLSYVYLGLELLRNADPRLSAGRIRNALTGLTAYIAAASGT